MGIFILSQRRYFHAVKISSPVFLTLSTMRAANLPPRLMPADRAKLGCSLKLDEAEKAVQKSSDMDVTTCSGRIFFYAMLRVLLRPSSDLVSLSMPL